VKISLKMFVLRLLRLFVRYYNNIHCLGDIWDKKKFLK
jgi:hypothetical protein